MSCNYKKRKFLFQSLNFKKKFSIFYKETASCFITTKTLIQF